jgi:hypothetical protein
MCHHYEVLNEHLHVKSSLGTSPMFGAAAQTKNKELAVVKYPWNKSKKSGIL